MNKKRIERCDGPEGDQTKAGQTEVPMPCRQTGATGEGTRQITSPISSRTRSKSSFLQQGPHGSTSAQNASSYSMDPPSIPSSSSVVSGMFSSVVDSGLVNFDSTNVSSSYALSSSSVSTPVLRSNRSSSPLSPEDIFNLSAFSFDSSVNGVPEASAVPASSSNSPAPSVGSSRVVPEAAMPVVDTGWNNTKRRRIVWQPIRNRMQEEYNRSTPRYKKFRDLWRAVRDVRAELTAKGIDQSMLDKGKTALAVKGVVYCIFSPFTKRLYVGETRHSAQKRFEEHIRGARAESARDKTPLHVAMARIGSERFFTFPLEAVEREALLLPNNELNDLLRTREVFWIERLHAYGPRGFNVQYCARQRIRRHRRRKVGMRRHRIGLPVQTGVGVGQEGGLGGEGETWEYPGRRHGSRDFERRCLFLIKQVLRDSDFLCAASSDVILGKYRTSVLWRMKWTLAHLKPPAEPPDGWEAAREKVCDCVGLFLEGHRCRRPKVLKEKLIMYILWNDRRLRSIGLKPLLMSTDMKERLPEEARGLMTTQLLLMQRKLLEPVGRKLLNYPKIRRAELDEEMEGCACANTFGEKYRTHEGCVLTGDCSIVRNTALRRLFEYGPQFRLDPGGDVMEELKGSLDQFIEAMRVKLGTGAQLAGIVPPTSAFAEWREAVVGACKTRIDEADASAQVMKDDDVPRWFTSKMKRALLLLNSQLVMVPTDKAPSNIAFVCRKLYLKILKQELEEEGSYERVVGKVGSKETIKNQVIKMHYEKMNEWSLDSRSRSRRGASKSHAATEHNGTDGADEMGDLGFVYWMPKFHKNPTGRRFIASMASCTTTHLSKVLSDILNEMLEVLKAKDNVLIAEKGVRRCFVVSGYEDVAGFLHRWADNSGKGVTDRLWTGDFSQMYTSIPHEDLLLKIDSVLQECWDFKFKTEEMRGDVNSVCVVWEKRDGNVGLRWQTGGASKRALTRNATTSHAQEDFKIAMHQNTSHTLNRVGLSEMVKWLVNNIFVCNGAVVRRQVIGIPMGTNCAPALANLYLYAYEAAFIDRLMDPERGPAGLATARKFARTFRLIDDVLSVDNDVWEGEVEGMYPSQLTLNRTGGGEGDGAAVQFLGMDIRYTGRQVVMDVFDKRKEFPFPVIRYPHMDSLIPAGIPYGVWTGQLHRYFRICSLLDDFLKHCLHLARVLVSKGCKIPRLCRVFANFVFLQHRVKWRRNRVDTSRRFRRLLMGGANGGHEAVQP